MPASAPRTALRRALLVLLALPVVALAAPAAHAAAPAGASVGAPAAVGGGTSVLTATVLTATVLTAPVLPAPAIPAPPASLPADPAGDLVPPDPAPGAPASDPSGSLKIDLDGPGEEPSQAILAILALTVLSLAPALLLLTTSFTRIVIVLSLTRNALGVQAIPPNQVIVGLSLFLSLFIMAPTFDRVYDDAIQPLLNKEKTYSEAYEAGVKPVREFMFKEVKEKELALFIDAAGDERPKNPEDVSMTALVPAFVLSEIKTAFIIGFVIFIPFLVIDIVVSSSLMSMGMMMLPPVLISLPFKLLLFVMVDGWALIVRSLITSYT
jgi:flagellar biosynthetic protein FliP